MYTSDEFMNARTQKPMVGINTKSGLISLNGAAAEEIGLSEKNMVFLALDDTNGMHLIGIIENEAGFALRRGKNEKGVSFNNSSLSRQIAGDLGIKEMSLRLRLTGDTKVIEMGGGTVLGHYLVKAL